MSNNRALIVTSKHFYAYSVIYKTNIFKMEPLPGAQSSFNENLKFQIVINVLMDFDCTQSKYSECVSEGNS